MRSSVTTSSGAERVREEVDDEVGDRDRALAVGSAGDDVGAGREQHRVPVALGVAVRDRTAHRSEVAHERVGDPRRGRRDRAEGQIRPHDVGVANERADAQMPVVPFERVETGNPIDVDELRGCREPRLHHRDEALAAREDAGVVTARGLRGDRLVE